MNPDEIKFSCKKCSQPIIATLDHVGLNVPCPNCGEELVVLEPVRVEDEPPGIARLPYFFIMLALGALDFMLIKAYHHPEVTVLLIMIYLCGIYPKILRLKNIGYSPWLCLLVLVPVANLILGLICLTVSTGEGRKKKTSRLKFK